MRSVSSVVGNEAGMTVAEVIIALGIITVGLLALIAAMPLGTSQIGESNRKTTATFLAQHRFEQIKNAQWTTAIDKLGGAGSNGGGAVSVAGMADRWPDEDYQSIVIVTGQNDAVSYPSFRRQVRIADCSIVSCSGIATATVNSNALRQVTVTVFFFPLTGTGQRGSEEESVPLVTLIARRP